MNKFGDLARKHSPQFRRSVIVDALARSPRPLATSSLAVMLEVDLGVMCTRVRQLEESGRIKPVGTATRTRDVRWAIANPEDARRVTRRVKFNAQEVLDAMREVCRQRLVSGC